MSSDFFLLSREDFPLSEIGASLSSEDEMPVGSWNDEYRFPILDHHVRLTLRSATERNSPWQYFEPEEAAQITAMIEEPRWVLSVTYSLARIANTAFLALPNLQKVVVENDRGFIVPYEQARGLAQTGPEWLSRNG